MARPRVVSWSAAEWFKLRNTPEEKKLFPGNVVPPAGLLCMDVCMSTAKGGRGLAVTAQVGIVAQKLTGNFCFVR